MFGRDRGSRSGSNRSAEERARAAAERARRRAEREGRPVDPPPPEVFDPEARPEDWSPWDADPAAQGPPPEPVLYEDEPEPVHHADPSDYGTQDPAAYAGEPAEAAYEDDLDAFEPEYEIPARGLDPDASGLLDPPSAPGPPPAAEEPPAAAVPPPVPEPSPAQEPPAAAVPPPVPEPSPAQEPPAAAVPPPVPEPPRAQEPPAAAVPPPRAEQPAAQEPLAAEPLEVPPPPPAAATPPPPPPPVQDPAPADEPPADAFDAGPAGHDPQPDPDDRHAITAQPTVAHDPVFHDEDEYEDPLEPDVDLPPRQPGPPPRLGRRGRAGREPKKAKIRAKGTHEEGRRARRRAQAAEFRPARQPARRKSAVALRIVAGLILVLVVGFGYIVNATFQPFAGEPEGGVKVVIPENTSVADIGKVLEANEVVPSGFFFNLNATLTGRRSGLRPGTYTLPKGMTNAEALDALKEGPKVARKRIKTFKLTITEGRARTEIARLLKQDTSIEGSYLEASADRRLIAALKAPRGTKTLEGYLFPATFTLPEGSDAKDVVDAQLQAFRENISGVRFCGEQAKARSRYEILIIASMIEREAQIDRERKLIAAVIYNRLRKGIPLGIDATIRYAEDNWTSPLKQSELQRPGPYNTRLKRGLPPTPIGNPGLASIEAAACPSRKNYLFYVVKPGRCGEHAFSSTDAQFARDVEKYNTARANKGGKSPTTCPE